MSENKETKKVEKVLITKKTKKVESKKETEKVEVEKETEIVEVEKVEVEKEIEKVEVEVETEKEVKVEVKKVEKFLTKMEWFTKSISSANFQIFQNDILIATSSDDLIFSISDKYFELYSVKYSYDGITIKNN